MARAFLRLTFIISLLLVAASAWASVPGLQQAQADCQPNPFLVCPAVYAPVLCDDGNVYSNQCVANRVCATGCELLFGPIELRR
ncbi:MAG TPA: hypothetical protein VLV83_12940 [Acidobacteriota bacterium]|nr:hypothetical protein [Acidobacteriota bacterium]